jgi:hypothetical protein
MKSRIEPRALRRQSLSSSSSAAAELGTTGGDGARIARRRAEDE